MTKVGKWIKSNAKALAFLMGGILIGMLIVTPIAPWQLPESTANLFGAAIGSSITVFAAAWLADSRERQKSEDAKQLIRQTFDVLHSAAKAFCKEADSFNDHTTHRTASLASIEFCRVYFETESTFQVMLPVFESAGPRGLKCYGDTKRAMDSLHQAYDQLTHLSGGPNVDSNPGHVAKTQAIQVRTWLGTLFQASQFQ